MAVCRSVGYVAFLYAVVVLQVADGNVEDLERFLLSIQDCISHIERCTAPGNDRNMEYMHDHLEGFVQIIAAFSLVLANVPGFFEIKVLIDDLLHSLRELLNHIRDKIAASFQVSAEFRSVPSAKEVHQEDQNTTLQQNKLMYFAAPVCSGQLLQSV